MPPRKERINLICTECGIGYQRLQCQIRPGSLPYCSNACVGKSKRNGAKLLCLSCDGEFYRALAEQDIGEKINQFCSKDCYHGWRRIGIKSSTYLKIGAEHAHRVIAEAVLNRELTIDEVVHHIDFDKHNNHPGNLCVFPNQSLHARCHFGVMLPAELDLYRLLNIAGAKHGQAADMVSLA